ncbi:MAG: DMT family transporter [Nitrospinota bacterium]|nr:DMT family transporter [Nitrospinota bacterium]
MNDTTLAALFALLTAAIGGPVSVIIRRGQAYGNATIGVLIGLIVSLPLLYGATALLWDPDWWDIDRFGWFVALGLVGPSLGRVFMYQSVHHLGVARAIPLIATLPLTTAVAAFGLLGERPGPYIWAGTLLVVAGCIGITMKGRAGADWDRRFLWYPLLSVTGFTAGNILRKVGLNANPSVIFGVTVTYTSSVVFLFLLRRFLPPTHRPDLSWGNKWGFYGVCGLCNTVTFMSRFAATRFGDLTIVAPIFGTSTLFALLASWIFLRDLERITWPVAAGAVMIMFGGALVAWRVL